MIQITVRKDYNGTVIAERETKVAVNQKTELKFLGQLLAGKLKNDTQFQVFCESLGR